MPRLRPRCTLPRRVRLALSELKKGLRELYGERFRGLYLYGSYARGTADSDSDVDVLVVLAGEVNPYAEISRANDLLSGIDLRHDVLISFVAVPEGWLRESPGAICSSVRREGVLV